MPSRRHGTGQLPLRSSQGPDGLAQPNSLSQQMHPCSCFQFLSSSLAPHPRLSLARDSELAPAVFCFRVLISSMQMKETAGIFEGTRNIPSSLKLKSK